MPLPLILAMTPLEIKNTPSPPTGIAWMACHFSPHTEGITNIPETLPSGAMLILTDRESCAGHSADLVAQQLSEAVARLDCESVLLDFQRAWNAETDVMAKTVVRALPCPVAVTENYASNTSCPLLLSPCPLHIPLEAYLGPWSDREIWLEAALCQERIAVDRSGAVFSPVYPSQPLEGGFYDQKLRCRYVTEIHEDRLIFTLFDTCETLAEKLDIAHSLGVTRAVGLYQEIGTFLSGK